jgi:hypothetical protein
MTRDNHGLGIPAGLAGRVAGGAGTGLKFPPATNPHPQRGLENTRTGFLFGHHQRSIYQFHCHQTRHPRTCQHRPMTIDSTHGLRDSQHSVTDSLPLQHAFVRLPLRLSFCPGQAGAAGLFCSFAALLLSSPGLLAVLFRLFLCGSPSVPLVPSYLCLTRTFPITLYHNCSQLPLVAVTLFSTPACRSNSDSLAAWAHAAWRP